MAYVGSFSHFVFVFSLSLSLSLSLPVSLSLSSPSVHPPSSYVLSSSHTIFKNMAHDGSFSHFVFLKVLSLSLSLSLRVSLSLSSRGRQWIVRVMSFRNLYF